MPARPQGVYPDGRGGWYFKVTLGSDPLTGKRVQITKRGYRTASAAARDRRELLAKIDTGQVRPSSKVLTVNEPLDLYLDGADADARLSPKTRFDYRNYCDSYIRPLLGARKVRDVTAEVVMACDEARRGDGRDRGQPDGVGTAAARPAVDPSPLDARAGRHADDAAGGGRQDRCRTVLVAVDPARLLKRLARGDLANVSFRDMRSLVEAFGFRSVRVSGSHHFFARPDVPELINLQAVKGQAKPYQVRQFLKLVERYGLSLEEP